MISNQSVFACNMNALSPVERVRHGVNTVRLMKNLQGIQENMNGYSLHFAKETRNIRQIAEFISFERLCCPFFDFMVQIRAEDEYVEVQISGAEGIKDFIRSEFGEAFA